MLDAVLESTICLNISQMISMAIPIFSFSLEMSDLFKDIRIRSQFAVAVLHIVIACFVGRYK